jgi:hypothetical protein
VFGRFFSAHPSKEAQCLLIATLYLSGSLANIRDDITRDDLTTKVDISLSSERVVWTLNQVIAWRRKPLAIQPGTDQQNACVERYNCTVRTE